MALTKRSTPPLRSDQKTTSLLSGDQMERDSLAGSNVRRVLMGRSTSCSQTSSPVLFLYSFHPYVAAIRGQGWKEDLLLRLADLAYFTPPTVSPDQTLQAGP